MTKPTIYNLSMNATQRALLLRCIFHAVNTVNVEPDCSFDMDIKEVSQLHYVRDYVTAMPSEAEGGVNCAMWFGQDEFNETVAEVMKMLADSGIEIIGTHNEFILPEPKPETPKFVNFGSGDVAVVSVSTDENGKLQSTFTKKESEAGGE